MEWKKYREKNLYFTRERERRERISMPEFLAVQQSQTSINHNLHLGLSDRKDRGFYLHIKLLHYF